MPGRGDGGDAARATGSGRCQRHRAAEAIADKIDGLAHAFHQRQQYFLDMAGDRHRPPVRPRPAPIEQQHSASPSRKPAQQRAVAHVEDVRRIDQRRHKQDRRPLAAIIASEAPAPRRAPEGVGGRPDGLLIFPQSTPSGRIRAGSAAVMRAAWREQAAGGADVAVRQASVLGAASLRSSAMAASRSEDAWAIRKSNRRTMTRKARPT